MTLKVMIVDDHEILRAGLRGLLDRQHIDVVGETGDGRTAVRIAKQLRPDLIIMDIGMPDMNGIDATRRLIEILPEVKILALSMHSDRRFVKQMLEAGALGYLLKDCAVDELAFAIRTLTEGRIYISPGIAATVVDSFIRRRNVPGDPAGESVLSTREREVLQLIAEGNSTVGIAMTLNLSPKTVETHRKRIMDKLRLHSVAELTKYAVREGLTHLS